MITKKTKFTRNIHSADTELGEKNRLMQEYTQLADNGPGSKKTSLENEKEALDKLEEEISTLEKSLNEFKAEKQALVEKMGEKKALSDPDYIYKLLDSINDGISLRYKQDKHVILDRSYNKHLNEDKNKDIPEEKKLQPIEFINIEEKLEDEKETLDKEKESLNAEEGLLNLQQAALDVSKKEIDDNKEKWRDKIYKREFVKYIDKKTKFLIEDKLGHDLRTESYNYRLDDYNSKCEQYKKHILDQKAPEEAALKDIPEELKTTIAKIDVTPAPDPVTLIADPVGTLIDPVTVTKTEPPVEAVAPPEPVIVKPEPTEILTAPVTVIKADLPVKEASTAAISSDGPSFDEKLYNEINLSLKKGGTLQKYDGYKSHGRELTKDQVTLIQQNLKYLGGYDLGNSGPNKDGVDGKFGKLTETAIKQFQKKHNLDDDGVYGLLTNEVLISKVQEKYCLKGLEDRTITEEEHNNAVMLKKLASAAGNINTKTSNSLPLKEAYNSRSLADTVQDMQYNIQLYRKAAANKETEIMNEAKNTISADIKIMDTRLGQITNLDPELAAASRNVMTELLDNNCDILIDTDTEVNTKALNTNKALYNLAATPLLSKGNTKD